MMTTVGIAWWRHQMETFSALLAICVGNSRVPVNSPHKGQWRGALIFSLICIWINDWVDNRGAGDLRRYRAHYDVTVMVRFSWATRHHCSYQWVDTLKPERNDRYVANGTVTFHFSKSFLFTNMIQYWFIWWLNGDLVQRRKLSQSAKKLTGYSSQGVL